MLKGELPFTFGGLLGLNIVSPDLMRQCKEGYDLLDVRGKVVLDIGADWGNSPLYFWARGARRIIAYESDWRKRVGLHRLAARGVPVEVRGGWDCEYPEADVLKMDIEGGEIRLDLFKLDEYQSWAVAIHTATFALRDSLVKKGAVLVHKQRGEEVWVKA
jgi:hypothetical protein